MKIQSTCIGMVYILHAQGELMRLNESLPGTKIYSQYMMSHIPHPLDIINKTIKIGEGLEKELVLILVASSNAWQTQRKCIASF